jgi:hypothetical protein
MAPSRLGFFVLSLATLCLACATPQKSEKEAKVSKKVAIAQPLTRGMVPRLDAVRPVPADSGIPDPMELGTYSVTRQISMYYRMDLLRDNAHAKDMATIMHIYDAPVRACYVDRLDSQPALRGDVDLSFAMSKNSGGMERIRHVGGTLKDPQLVKCLKRRLAEIPFQPPRNMQGKLRYRFDSSTSGAAKLIPVRTAAGR